MSHDNKDPNHRMFLSVLPCIVCHKRLDSAFEGEDNHPENGVVCITRGNYGSPVFDEVDGHFLEFNVCDECLKKAAERNEVALGFLGTLVDVPLRLWRPGLEDEYPTPEIKERARQRSTEIEDLLKKE